MQYKPKIIVRNAYSEQPKPKIKDYGKSRTQQHFTEESLINNIMQKHTSGILADANQNRTAQFGNYDGETFREMQTKLALANEQFLELPIKIRKRFDHEVANLLDFAHDEENREEAIEMGWIIPPEPEKEAKPVTVIIQKDPFSTPEAAKADPEPSGQQGQQKDSK